MITLHALFNDSGSGEWKEIYEISLLPLPELYSDPAVGEEDFGINQSKFALPNGEELELSATYTGTNMGVVVIVGAQGKTLVQVTCYKQTGDKFDPSIMFLTPGGAYVNIMASANS